MKPTILLAFAFCFLAPVSARADCAPIDGYHDFWPTVKGREVTICGSGCQSQGLLRRSITDGTTVRITTCDKSGGCFVDSCAPPGDYQYGRPDTLACAGDSCDAPYYTTVTISPSNETCAYPDPVPELVAGVPWRDNPMMCEYDRGCAVGAGVPGRILGAGAFAFAVGLALFLLQRTRRRDRASPRG
jgi:hypothetical protein